jgi:uncharacterized membrane protein
LREALNSRLPGRYRATANSLVSFGFRGTFVLTAPFVGQVLELWGMTATLWMLAAGALLIFVALMVPLIIAVADARRVSARVPESAVPDGVPAARQTS